VHAVRRLWLPALGLTLLLGLLALPWVQRRGGALPATGRPLSPPAAPATAAPTPGRDLELVDFLPVGFVRDGSVDYRAELQHALEAAVGTRLRLPDFPVLLRAAPGKGHAVLLPSRTHLVGRPGSLLRTDAPGLQLLRGEAVEDLRLEGFAVEGPGGDGQGLGHGLIQVTQGERVALQDLVVRGADADGIALAAVRGARVEGCLVDGASKAGIYLSSCDGALVARNRVEGFGGHLMGDGSLVGAGLQLSSCRDLVCVDNLVREGLGVGVLCNALQGGAPPLGNLLRGNRVRAVENLTNPDLSGGLRLANGSGELRTGTLVSGNSIEDCGRYGLVLENHGDSLVEGNLVRRSAGAGIVVGSVEGLVVRDNLVIDSGAKGEGPPGAIQLVNGARGVQLSGNAARLPDAAGAAPLVVDHGTPGPHSLEARVVRGDGPPSLGAWQRGDLVLQRAPASGAPLGWACVAGGAPGTWLPFGLLP
jgi:hypothetical protein